MKCRYCDFTLYGDHGLDGEYNRKILLGHWKKCHPIEYKEFRKFMGRSYEFTLEKTKESFEMQEVCG